MLFQWCCGLRDLNSFPTRRSSDLDDYTIADVATLGWVRNLIGFYEARSEEHTSELQSRRDLVCRLRLEKKKMVALACVRATRRLLAARSCRPSAAAALRRARTNLR